jgi:hypothetical protein
MQVSLSINGPAQAKVNTSPGCHIATPRSRIESEPHIAPCSGIAPGRHRSKSDNQEKKDETILFPYQPAAQGHTRTLV